MILLLSQPRLSDSVRLDLLCQGGSEICLVYPLLSWTGFPSRRFPCALIVSYHSQALTPNIPPSSSGSRDGPWNRSVETLPAEGRGHLSCSIQDSEGE